MATFHLSMKIGYSGSTIPHLKYVTREDKYEDKSEDLIYKNTHNLPEWATSETDFWEAVDSFDYRSYRKITFSLPNEISKEEQIKLTEQYLEKLLPDKTYTFAIHEVESAIHKEKNPHVHVLFSERIIDDRTRKMTKSEFFSKFGRSKKGQEYGGSTKDRSWAGKKNTKLLEIRKELENQINDSYKKNGLDLKVSCSTLEEQKKSFLFLGDIEKAELYNREKPVRLDEKIFNTYREEIKSMVFADFSLEDLTDPIMITRVLQEREKLVKNDIYSFQSESDQTLKPTTEEQYLAIQNSIKVCEKLLSEQPKNIKEEMITNLMAKAKELGISSHNSAGVRLYPVLKTEDLILERITSTIQNVEKTVARQELEIEALSKNKESLTEQLKKGFYSQTLDKITEGKNKEIYDKIRSQKSLLDYNQKLGNDTITYQVAIKDIEKEIAELQMKHSNKEVLTNAEEKLTLYLKDYPELQAKQNKLLSELIKDSKRKNIKPELATRIKGRIQHLIDRNKKGLIKQTQNKTRNKATTTTAATKVKDGIKSVFDTGREGGVASIRTNSSDREL